MVTHPVRLAGGWLSPSIGFQFIQPDDSNGLLIGRSIGWLGEFMSSVSRSIGFSLVVEDDALEEGGEKGGRYHYFYATTNLCNDHH